MHCHVLHVNANGIENKKRLRFRSIRIKGNSDGKIDEQIQDDGNTIAAISFIAPSNNCKVIGMASALSSCVSSLRSTNQLLSSSISILDSGVNDFPRLSKVLQTTRVRIFQQLIPLRYGNSIP